MGIITDRDMTVRVMAEGSDPGTVHAEDVMTPGRAGAEDRARAGGRRSRAGDHLGCLAASPTLW